MLPEIDGLEVCKRLRSAPETAMLPIIMLTAKAEETDQVIGLELGADDYVTKPFSPKALVARVKALLRRVDRSRQETQTSYQYGKLSMDLDRHEVTVQGKDVPLTAKEFGLLEHLLRHPGRVLTREVLLNQVWGYDYFGTTRTVDVHVRRLKQKIPLLDEAILSVKSLGYKLKEPGSDIFDRAVSSMTLSIRWKVTLAILFALVCGFVIAGVLAARSLAEQELAQSERALEVSTNLIAFDLRPLVTGSSPCRRCRSFNRSSGS